MTDRNGLRDYDRDGIPPLVEAAVAKAREVGFPLACTPETGRLLMMLAAQHGRSRVAELGTGCGVGAAWIATGLREGARLVTVEADARRAQVARAVLAGRRDVQVLTGDWTLVREHGPFDLVFSDGGPKRNPGDPELLAEIVRPGGTVVLDDYTPEAAWTPEQRRLYADDVSRRIWLENGAWSAVEVAVAPDMAVILAVRLR